LEDRAAVEGQWKIREATRSKRRFDDVEQRRKRDQIGERRGDENVCIDAGAEGGQRVTSSKRDREILDGESIVCGVDLVTTIP